MPFAKKKWKTSSPRGARGRSQNPRPREARHLVNVGRCLGHSHVFAANDRFGDDEEKRFDIDDRGLRRAQQTMKVVRQSATARADYQRAPQLARSDDPTNGVHRLLILGVGAIVPTPVTVKAIAIFDDASRQPAGCGRLEGAAERGAHPRDEVRQLAASSVGHGFQARAAGR